MFSHATTRMPREFFPSLSSGIPDLFFISFLQSCKSQEEPAGLPRLLAAAFPIQAHLPAANKTCRKEPPAALGESKLEVQVTPRGWFCNKPASSFLSLSSFIQRVLPIPRKPEAAILQGDRPKFQAKHLLTDQLPWEERGRWNKRRFKRGDKCQSFSGGLWSAWGTLTMGMRIGPALPAAAGFQLHSSAFPTTPPAPGRAHIRAE